MMGGIKVENEKGVNKQGRRINNFRFADDRPPIIDTIEEKRKKRQESLKQLTEAGEGKLILEINISKTKIMVNGRKVREEEQLSVKDKKIENITDFVYLGSLLTEDNDESRKVLIRISMATGATHMEQDGKIWRSKNISTGTQINILKVTVMSVVTYANETWTIKKKDKDRLLAFSATEEY